MKEKFDLGEFLRSDGAIYAQDQQDWVSTLRLLQEHGFEVAFRFSDNVPDANDYPYIKYRSETDQITAYTERWAEKHAITDIMTYTELLERLGALSAPGPAATPDEILSMLYEGTI